MYMYMYIYIYIYTCMYVYTRSLLGDREHEELVRAAPAEVRDALGVSCGRRSRHVCIYIICVSRERARYYVYTCIV